MDISMEAVITMQGVFLVLWSLSIYLLKKLINDMDTRISKNETEIKEIKENYIDRFDNIKEKVNETEKRLMERLHSTELRIIEEISKLKHNDNSHS